MSKQEPIAHITGYYRGYCIIKPTDPAVVLPVGMALYRSPKEWVGLTDEEVSYCRYAATFCDELDTAYMAELIEQALKEKNHG